MTVSTPVLMCMDISLTSLKISMTGLTVLGLKITFFWYLDLSTVT